VNQVEFLKEDEAVKLEGEGTAIEHQANSLAIVDGATRAMAADMRERARQFKKKIQELFVEPKRAANEAHTKICNLEKKMYGPADKVIKIIDGKASDYDLEQKRLAKIEADKAAVEKARLDKIEADRLLARAAKAEEKGQDEKADLLLEQAANVDNFVPPPPEPPKQIRTDSGTTSGTMDFDIEVINPINFIQQVVMAGGNFGFIEFKNGPIKRYAEGKKIGDVLPVIPGCKLTPKVRYSGREFSGRAAVAHTN
jgi:hypothetical protein